MRLLILNLDLVERGWGLPEHGLHVDDGLGVGHVVLLGAHGALLVHHHQVVCVDDPTLEQVVQAARTHRQG